jgi:predicted alpha-1,2-mannosidase
MFILRSRNVIMSFTNSSCPVTALSAMRRRLFSVCLIILLLCVSGFAMGGEVQQKGAGGADLAYWVDPMIGTAGGGDVFPGADVPGGMVQWSPDNTSAPGGYRWQDEKITRGFSFTHFSGRGCSAYQDIPIMPVVGSLTDSPVVNAAAYGSKFSHQNEKASPGYYGVRLDDSNVQVELTVALRSGIGRFTYPSSGESHMVINLNGSANGNTDSSVSIVGDRSITGETTSKTGCGSAHYKIYFVAEADRPFASFGIWNDAQKVPMARKSTSPHTAAYVTFDTTKQHVVQFKVGISYVSISNAMSNLHAEIPGWSFNSVRTQAKNSWNDILNRIQVTGGTDAEKTVFYTALYHSFIHPNVFSDVNGQYLGFDGHVHEAVKYIHYENYPTWDMYRSLIQLRALLTPKETSDMMQSLVDDALQGGGAMPKWQQINSNSGGMGGDSPTVVVANAIAYGATKFDQAAAFKAAEFAATDGSARSDGHLAREALAEYMDKGYISTAQSKFMPRPFNTVASGPAYTLEYAADDFALAQMALHLGYEAKSQKYLARSMNWKNVFNLEYGYIRPRDPNGSWSTQSKLTTTMVEGDSLQYTWMIPFDLRELFDSMGGAGVVVQRLDKHFTHLNAGETSEFAWMGNEPEEVAPWEYDFAGAPWRTQDVVRRISRECFKATPDGLPGNDDGGAMSSWEVWAMLGIFPEIPGVGGFVIGSPLFPEARLRTEGGHSLHILGLSAGQDHQYVQSLLLNGRRTSKLWLPMGTILARRNTSLVFRLGDQPNRSWGASISDAPPSFGEVKDKSALSSKVQ